MIEKHTFWATLSLFGAMLLAGTQGCGSQGNVDTATTPDSGVDGGGGGKVPDAGGPGTDGGADAQTGMPGCIKAPCTQIFMSTTGDDASTGLTPSAPIKTLKRADEIVARHLPEGHVEVRIAPGTYTDADAENSSNYVDWQSWSKTHHLYIVARDYVPGGPAPAKPVFDGRHALPRFFRFWQDTGADANIHLLHLTIQNFYGIAVTIRGDKAWTGGFEFQHVVFSHIGNYDLEKPSAVELGFAAISMDWVRNTVVHDCTFEFIRNKPRVCTTNAEDKCVDGAGNLVGNPTPISADATLIHAVYAKDGSNYNRIERCTSRSITGDVYKFRNRSSYNTVQGCTDIKSGAKGFVLDSAQGDDEANSHDNVIKDNVVGCDFTCQKKHVACYQTQDCKGPGGVIPDNAFILSGNTNECGACP